jgi:acyl carrier protein
LPTRREPRSIAPGKFRQRRCEASSIQPPILPPESILNVAAELKSILAEILSLGSRVDRFTDQTQLLGSLPELDSMAVVSVITTIEERFGIMVGDDEISAETFATFGSLRTFVEDKL